MTAQGKRETRERPPLHELQEAAQNYFDVWDGKRGTKKAGRLEKARNELRAALTRSRQS